MTAIPNQPWMMSSVRMIKLGMVAIIAVSVVSRIDDLPVGIVTAKARLDMSSGRDEARHPRLFPEFKEEQHPAPAMIQAASIGTRPARVRREGSTARLETRAKAFWRQNPPRRIHIN